MGVFRKIRQYTPSFILKLYQRRLHDPNAEITAEEFFEAIEELNVEQKMLAYRIDKLNDAKDMLERLIRKDDLYSPIKRKGGDHGSNA